MSHYESGLAHCLAVIELDAERRNGTSPAVAYLRASESCVAWEQDVTAGAPPGDMATVTDDELADRAAIFSTYATWCDLAMSDPATAQAQEPDLDLPDQAETDRAHALDDAYVARDLAAITLGL